MSFDLDSLRAACARHGTVARVMVAAVAGSAPREVGAAMLVWDGGQSGTIGGGALEYEAARVALTGTGLSQHPLGPALGQCCGGAVTLLTEHFTPGTLPEPGEAQVFARPVDGTPTATPLPVARLIDRARARGQRPPPQLVQGWMVEPVLAPTRSLWIWGAGHVGRALVDALAPLPDLDITWVDTAPERFPDTIPDRVTSLPAAAPARLMPRAPRDAHHLILTYSHALDLELCHAALTRGFGFCGLIGSDTKRARFASRLRALGHSDAQIDSICCPIGQKALGKHPQAIAIGVAAQILARERQEAPAWTTSSSASTA